MKIILEIPKIPLALFTALLITLFVILNLWPIFFILSISGCNINTPLRTVSPTKNDKRVTCNKTLKICVDFGKIKMKRQTTHTYHVFFVEDLRVF